MDIKSFIMVNQDMIYVVFIILITILFERLIRYLFNKKIKSAARHMHFDQTEFVFFKHFISIIIYIVGFGFAVYLIPQLKALALSLFAGAGVIAIVFGVASQKAFSNIVSGMFIALSKPFRIGDLICITESGKERLGYVEDISLRHTTIRNFENKRYIIPNSIIAEETIENYNIDDEKICKYIEMSISYDSNIDKAMKIMKEEILKHPLFLDVRTEQDIKDKKPAVSIKVVGFGDSSVNLRGWAWSRNPKDAFNLACDLRKSIKEKFDKNRIEIPFPYRTIVQKKMKK